jgi:hypothetical protein
MSSFHPPSSFREGLKKIQFSLKNGNAVAILMIPQPPLPKGGQEDFWEIGFS